MDSAGGPSFVSIAAAPSLRAKIERLIARHWTKNCESPVIGPASVEAAHMTTLLQTARQFFRIAEFFK
ncbi:hypothetical protein TH5_06895 [Thalassospira xianhensis MCCC 1A02616]|uniref:Uncharacterized protein n=1 Tax=Thalassospira xianhensis MCCC 1A02616 TaxID=1177929 RepID=A0A367UHR9_9PROT|nr:hypothetical protein TH5_06895 [Thalassospira xianhensis MCCC 1A02616]